MLVAVVTRCKKSLCIRFKIRSLFPAEIAPCRKFNSHSLQNYLVTHYTSCSLLEAFYKVNKNTALI